MSESIIIRPTLINEEVVWDKSKTIISTTDKFGTITDVNQVFIDVSGYSAIELLGKSHNIIRHPDTPKIIFKIIWDNISTGRNFHAIVKNLAKSGKYYWVITDFEVNRNILGNVVSIMAKRKSVPDMVITKHIAPLYETLTKLEKVGGMELSARYFKGLLENQKLSYLEYLTGIMEESNSSVVEKNPQLVAVPDDIFSDENEAMKHKGFFSKFFSN